MSNRIKLDSPARQIQYLLAIMCSQERLEKTDALSDDKLLQIYELLNEIFGKYMYAYYPTQDEIKTGLDEKWFKTRDVSMPTFLGYFFESEKIATDELRFDIINFYERFSEEIRQGFGLSNVDMLEISDAIGAILQRNFDEVADLMSRISKEAIKLESANEDEHDKMLSELKINYEPLVSAFNKRSREVCKFSFTELEGKFDSTILGRFKDLFVTVQGCSPEIHYITDDNPILKKPIVTANTDSYYLCSFNFLLLAVIKNIDDLFKNGPDSDRFRKHRDTQLENNVCKIFRDYLPMDALFIESAFENKLSSNEHDLIVIHDRTVLIIESKAAPRREPLRDPSKAYQRINDDFKRKSGIQSGYEQAHRLELLLESNNITHLYNKKGEVIATIKKEDFDEIFCLCVTNDDFGMLATNLTTLLDKDDEAKYPWVVSMHDLRFLMQCLEHIGKDWHFFVNYLRDRISVFGKLISNDELEFAGAYLKYGGFGFYPKGSEYKVFLDINESRVLDDIFFAKSTDEKYDLKIIESPYYELGKDKFTKRKNPTEKMKKAKKKIRSIAKQSKRSNR